MQLPTFNNTVSSPYIDHYVTSSNDIVRGQSYNIPPTTQFSFAQLQNNIHSFTLQHGTGNDGSSHGNNNDNSGGGPGTGSGGSGGNNNINTTHGLGHYTKKGQPNDPVPEDFRGTGSYQQYNRWYTIRPRQEDHAGFATLLSISLASIFTHLSIAPAERALLYSYTTLPQDVITRLGQLPSSTTPSPSTEKVVDETSSTITSKIRPNEPWLKGTLYSTSTFMTRHIITFLLFYMVIPTGIWPTTYHNACTKYQYNQPSQFEEFGLKLLAGAIAGVLGQTWGFKRETTTMRKLYNQRPLYPQEIPHITPLSTYYPSAMGYVSTIDPLTITKEDGTRLTPEEQEAYRAKNRSFRSQIKFIEYFKGLRYANLWAAVHYSILFTTHDWVMKRMLNRYEYQGLRPDEFPIPPALASCCAGGIAGAVAGSISYPFEVLKRQTQVHRLGMFNKVWKEANINPINNATNNGGFRLGVATSAVRSGLLFGSFQCLFNFWKPYLNTKSNRTDTNTQHKD